MKWRDPPVLAPSSLASGGPGSIVATHNATDQSLHGEIRPQQARKLQAT